MAWLAGRRPLHHWGKHIAPVDLCGQVGAPGHEHGATLCRAFKGYNNLGLQSLQHKRELGDSRM